MASLPAIRPRTALLTVLGAVVLLTALVGWRVWQVRGDLLQARDYAEALRSAGDERDLTDARVALTALREHAGDASDGTSGPSWWLLERFPVVGDDAAAVAVMAQSLSNLAEAVQPMVALTDDLDRGRLAPVDGRIPLDRIADLQAPLDRFADEVGGQFEQLGELEGDYVPAVVAARDEALKVLAEAEPRVRQISEVVRSLPEILGREGPRRYLLVFQNNGEIRATGGLPGSAAEITTVDGRIRLQRTFSPIALDERKLATFDFTSSERQLYGPLLQDHAAVFLNSMPDPWRASELLREGAVQWLGHRVDGVVLMDTVTISYLLKATGPIAVRGVTLTEANAVDQLLYGVYDRIRDPKAQDRFFGEVSKAVFRRLTSERSDVLASISAIRRSFEEGRTFLDLDGPAGRRLNRAVEPDRTTEAVLGLNDVGGGKMSYFLRHGVNADSCISGDRQVLAGSLGLTSTAPLDPSILPPRFENNGAHWQPVGRGAQLVQVVLQLPAGWKIQVMTVDGETSDSYREVIGLQRSVALLQAEIGPQAGRTIAWRASGPIGAPVTVVRTTPSVVPGSSVLDVATNRC